MPRRRKAARSRGPQRRAERPGGETKARKRLLWRAKNRGKPEHYRHAAAVYLICTGRANIASCLSPLAAFAMPALSVKDSPCWYRMSPFEYGRHPISADTPLECD